MGMQESGKAWRQAEPISKGNRRAILLRQFGLRWLCFPWRWPLEASQHALKTSPRYDWLLPDDRDRNP